MVTKVYFCFLNVLWMMLISSLFGYFEEYTSFAHTVLVITYTFTVCVYLTLGNFLLFTKNPIVHAKFELGEYKKDFTSSFWFFAPSAAYIATSLVLGFYYLGVAYFVTIMYTFVLQSKYKF